MPLSYPTFIVLYAASMLVGVFLGLLVTVGWKDMDWRKALASARFNALYVVLVVALPLVALAENLIRDPAEATSEVTYTNWIFSIGGDAVRILQDRLDYQVIADLFIIVYVWVFTYIVYFTPLLILSRDDNATFRRYAVALMFNYAVLLPFYLFFPVTVTGFYSESGVTPLLYINSNWGRMVTGMDPLNNDFPSGHVSLMLTALLVLSTAKEDYRIYYRFLIVACAGIVFVVLYLGRPLARGRLRRVRAGHRSLPRVWERARADDPGLVHQGGDAEAVRRGTGLSRGSGRRHVDDPYLEEEGPAGYLRVVASVRVAPVDLELVVGLVEGPEDELRPVVRGALHLVDMSTASACS